MKPTRMLQALSVATMVATYLHVLLGSGGTPGRLSALAVFLLALSTALYAWGTQQARRPVVLSSVVAIGLLGAQMGVEGISGALGLPPFLVTASLGVTLASLATWIVFTVVLAGDGPVHHLPVRSAAHWVVPLLGTVAVFAVMLFSTYTASVGATGACLGWPLCQGEFVPDGANSLVVLSFGHRLAAVLAGVGVLTTFGMTHRNQKHRPGLTGLSLLAISLYLMQVLVGALGALEMLPESLSMVHMATATSLFTTMVLLTVLSYFSPPIPAMAGGQVAVAALPTRPMTEVLRDYIQLMKPRIIVLLVITGYAAMWVAQGGFPDLALSFWAMLGLSLSCGGANAINMWFDRDIDAIMSRTQKRPIPSGRLAPEQALAFGVGLGIVSTLMLAVTVNVPTALLSLGGYIFYSFIYTMLLKRNTAQNIVIGGAAGAVPPLVGWAAITGDVSWASVVMFLIVFMWTPPHFWALALFKNEDYKRANVPMLPVVAGEAETKKQSLWYTVLLLPISLALYPLGVVGLIYLISAAVLGAIFIYYAVKLYRAPEGEQRPAHKLFGFSLLYLALIFLAMVIDAKPLV